MMPRRCCGDDRRPADTQTTLRTGFVRVLVFCKSCQHQADADLQATPAAATCR
jgi:hypothetical protein